MASVQAVATMLEMFAQLYPHRGVEQATAVAWEWALEGVPDDRMMWAARQIVQESGRTFFPTPNEVRAYLGHNPALPRPVPELRGDEWDAQFWTHEAIEQRNALLREQNGKRNAEYARTYPAVWGDRAHVA